MSKTDLVVPLGNGSKNDNLELRFLLRSLEKNFEDLGKVYIVTDQLPDWFGGPDVVHVFERDTLRRNKDGNMIRKVLKACTIDELSENFIRSSDDQILLKPLSLEKMKIYNIGSLANKKYDPENRWHDKLKNTLVALTDRGKTTVNYEAHVPAIYNKHKFIDIMNQYEYDKENEGFTINSLYFNNLDVPVESVRATADKITFEKENTLTAEEILKKLEAKVWLGYNDKGLNDEMKKALFKLFPNKSRFEKEELIHEYNIKNVSQNTIKAFTDREAMMMKHMLLGARKELAGYLLSYGEKKRIMGNIPTPLSDRYAFITDKIVTLIEENMTIKDLTDFEKSLRN